MWGIEDADTPAVTMERFSREIGWPRRIFAVCATVGCCVGFALLGMLVG